MRWHLVLVMLLFVPFVMGANDDLFKYSSMTLENTLTTGFRIEGGNADYVIVNLSIFPLDSPSNVIISRAFDPNVLPGSEFSWRFEEPGLGDHSVKVTSVVRSVEQSPSVTKHIPFPLQGLPIELEQYLGAKQIIDITPQIREQASLIAAEKDDLYEAVFALASWTKDNIAYELSSTTVDASLSASWVLQNRKGVCDELTALFIAMARSLGVPARFVSGVAYSNVGEGGFGPHGWAEVYFPEVGWVPFDVTYGEFGFVDATHIRMQESLDARKDSLEVLSKGFRVQFDTLPIEFGTRVLNAGDKLSSGVSLKVTPLYDEVGFGSYNGMKIVLRNQKSAYNPVTLRITQTEHLRYFPERFVLPVLLKPREEKTILIPVYVDPLLSKEYVYTFPLMVDTLKGESAQASFSASYSGVKYGLPDGGTIEEHFEFGSFKCSLDREVARVGSEVITSCIFVPDSTAQYSFCVVSQCFNQWVSARSPYEFSVSDDFNDPGIYGINARVSSGEHSMAKVLILRILDEPKVVMSLNDMPPSLGFDDNKMVRVEISKTSMADPLDMNLELSGSEYSNSWSISNYSMPLNLSFVFEGNRLLRGANSFSLKMSFTDSLGAHYSVEEPFVVVLKPMSRSQEIRYFLGRLSHWVSSAFESVFG
jgi:hypothetical protein